MKDGSEFLNIGSTNSTLYKLLKFGIEALVKKLS